MRGKWRIGGWMMGREVPFPYEYIFLLCFPVFYYNLYHLC